MGVFSGWNKKEDLIKCLTAEGQLEEDKINKIRDAFLDRVQKKRSNPSLVRTPATVSSEAEVMAVGTASYMHPEYEGKKFSASPAYNEVGWRQWRIP